MTPPKSDWELYLSHTHMESPAEVEGLLQSGQTLHPDGTLSGDWPTKLRLQISGCYINAPGFSIKRQGDTLEIRIDGAWITGPT